MLKIFSMSVIKEQTYFYPALKALKIIKNNAGKLMLSVS